MPDATRGVTTVRRGWWVDIDVDVWVENMPAREARVFILVLTKLVVTCHVMKLSLPYQQVALSVHAAVCHFLEESAVRIWEL